MPQYAATTEVTPGRSREEVERTLVRYGATGFMYGWDANQALIGFIFNGRQVRFILPMPDRNSTEFTRTPTGKVRIPSQVNAAYEQATRQRWRALSLVVKAKLEAVEAGIVTFEEEFAMHFVLPNGRTVAEHVLPAIEGAYSTGTVPSLLGLPPGSREIEK